MNRCICNFGFSGLAKSGYLLGKTHFSLTPGASKWSAAAAKAGKKKGLGRNGWDIGVFEIRHAIKFKSDDECQTQYTGTNWFGISVKLPPASMRLEKSLMSGAAWRCR